MAYVPPWKRQAAGPSTSTSTPAAATPPSQTRPTPYRPKAPPRRDGTYTVEEIVDKLGGVKMGTLNLFSYPIEVEKRGSELKGKSVREMSEEARKGESDVPAEAEKDEKDETPNLDELKIADPPSAPIPRLHPYHHLISWIHLVPFAHPAFESDNEIWLHTNAQVITEDEGQNPNLGRAIPFFGEQVLPGGGRPRGGGPIGGTGDMPFAGYWILKSFHKVPPQSPELKSLLERKQSFNSYGRQGRTPEAWAKAMKEQWVKVKVEKCENGVGELVDPMKMSFEGEKERGEGWLEVVLGGLADEELKKPRLERRIMPNGSEAAAKEATTTTTSPNEHVPNPQSHSPPTQQSPTSNPVIPSTFLPLTQETPEQREQRTVHDVYESIAGHFSETRYKPWPVIANFLATLPPNSIGLDSGAGNGKYLPVVRSGGSLNNNPEITGNASQPVASSSTTTAQRNNPTSIQRTTRSSRRGESWMIALDRSEGLLSVAKTQGDVPGGEECVRGDLGFGGWREGVFDFTISVAAIHHLSTPARRTHSIQTLLRPLALNQHKPDFVQPQHGHYSRFIIYVWAFEQGESSKRKMGILGGGEGEGEGDGQDVMVPWVMKGKEEKKVKAKGEKKKAKVKVRGEKKRGRNGDGAEAGVKQDEEGGKTDEQSVIPVIAAEPTTSPPPTVPATQETPSESTPQVFHRYYHLYKEGELHAQVIDAGREEGFDIVSAVPTEAGVGVGRNKWLRVVEEGYERDNWYIIGEVGLFPST